LALRQDESPEDGDVIAMMVMLYLKMGDLPAKNGKFDKEQMRTHAMIQQWIWGILDLDTCCSCHEGWNHLKPATSTG
jgi:hypothetical protein